METHKLVPIYHSKITQTLSLQPPVHLIFTLNTHTQHTNDFSSWLSLHIDPREYVIVQGNYTIFLLDNIP